MTYPEYLEALKAKFRMKPGEMPADLMGRLKEEYGLAGEMQPPAPAAVATEPPPLETAPEPQLTTLPPVTNVKDDSGALAMAEGMRNIGEGLGNIRFKPLPYHWGRGIMNVESPAPFVAEGPRRAIQDIYQGRRDKLRLATEAARQGFQAREGALNRASSEGIAKENREALGARTTTRQDIQDRTRLETAFSGERGKILGDVRHREIMNSLAGTRRVQALLDQAGDNPVAGRVAMVQVAKHLAGETGVLTQRDIDAYSQVMGVEGWWQRGEQFITSNFKPEHLERLRQVASTLQDVRLRELSDYKAQRGASFYETNRDILGRHGKTPEDIERSFGDLYTGSETPATEEPEASQAPTATTPSANGKVPAVGPNGQTGKVPPEFLEPGTEWYKKGWRRR